MTKEFDKMEKFAIKQLMKDNSHVTMALLVQKNNVVVTPLIFENDKQKIIIMKLLKMRIIEQEIKQYYFITETWISQDINANRPSEDPKKKEALLIALYKNDGSSEQSIQFFHKENGKVILDKYTKMGKNFDSSSAWNFYKDDTTKELIKKYKTQGNKNGNRKK